MNPELAKELAQSVEQFYEEHGAAFGRTRNMTWSELNELKSLLQPGITIVDVGAGNGRIAEQLPNNITYIGIEPSDSLRQSRPDRNLIKGALPNLPIESETADITICLAVFHHLADQERRQAAVNELIRITKPGGYIITSSWFLPINQYESIASGEPNDILVPWKAEGADVKRYVHVYSMDEWKRLWNVPELTIEHIGYYGRASWTEDMGEVRNLLAVAQKR